MKALHDYPQTVINDTQTVGNLRLYTQTVEQEKAGNVLRVLIWANYYQTDLVIGIEPAVSEFPEVHHFPMLSSVVPGALRSIANELEENSAALNQILCELAGLPTGTEGGDQ